MKPETERRIKGYTGLAYQTIMDGLVILCIYAGHHGYPGWGNVAMVVMWMFALVIAPLCLFSVCVQEPDTLRPRSVVQSTSGWTADIIILGMYAYHGQFVMSAVAILLMLEMIFFRGIIKFRYENHMKKKAKPGRDVSANVHVADE